MCQETEHQSTIANEGMSLSNLIALLLDVSPTARNVSRITGTLISMELALGPVVRLRTWALYAVLNSVHSLSCKVALTREAVEELNFWRDNFFRLCGKPIWRLSPKIELLSYFDASNVYFKQCGGICCSFWYAHRQRELVGFRGPMQLFFPRDSCN